ncbi:MAG: methionyl-tRNA formyltransferase [Oceanicoccus sp.]
MRFECLLIGEQSLLVQCGDYLLGDGHQIVAVVAENEAIVDWSIKHNITSFPSVKELIQSSFLDTASFDYLFSITNLKILPDALLAKAKSYAINFHDGPLPRYAGLNAPVCM